MLKLKQIFKKYIAVTGKTPRFMIVPFCSGHSICLNISFWQSSFKSKWCVFNLSGFNWKTFWSTSFSPWVFLRVTVERKWHSQSFDFLSLKICIQVSLEEHQLTQLNFKTFYDNLKIKSLVEKRVRLFYYFNFEKIYNVLNSSRPCFLLNKNINSKETRNSYFCVTPQNQVLHESASLFLMTQNPLFLITQKTLTKDIFQYLDLITETLSFLQIFRARKTTTWRF